MTVSPSTRVREAGTSQSVRRRARRRPSLSHVLIGIAIVLAFALNLVALQSRTATSQVAVASSPLDQGALLSMDDFHMIEIPSHFEGMSSLLTEAAIVERLGWVVEQPITEGGLIVGSALVEPVVSTGLRAMSVPISPEHAAGGRLSVGDRIDVISVEDGQAFYVVAGVEVIGVAAPASGSIGASGAFHVVVAVSSDQALALAVAIDSGVLEVIRSTGAIEVDGAP